MIPQISDSVGPIYKIHGLIVGISSIILAFLAPGLVPAFLAGAFLITLNFVLLAVFWKNILDKKHVAMTSGIIVFKYAILGILLYIFVKELKMPMLPFFAGVSTLGGSFVVVAIRVQFLEKKR